MTYAPQTAEGAEMIGVNDLPEQPLRVLRAQSWSAVAGESMGGRAGKSITAEIAQGAEMIGINDLPEQPLRPLRALR